MASSRYKFFADVKNNVTGTAFKGFPSTNLATLFSTTNDKSYTIPLKYQYRPDLIANYFYGDPTLFWVLVYSNNIQNSPEGFETDKIITIPYIARVVSLV